MDDVTENLLACEQALLLGRVKRVSRERARAGGKEAPRSRVLARLASLAQIGELARRLKTCFPLLVFNMARGFENVCESMICGVKASKKGTGAIYKEEKRRQQDGKSSWGLENLSC